MTVRLDLTMETLITLLQKRRINPLFLCYDIMIKLDNKKETTKFKYYFLSIALKEMPDD